MASGFKYEGSWVGNTMVSTVGCLHWSSDISLSIPYIMAIMCTMMYDSAVCGLFVGGSWHRRIQRWSGLSGTVRTSYCSGAVVMYVCKGYFQSW